MVDRKIDYIENYTDYHPGLSVDCVVITYHERKLKVLLSKSYIMDKLMLPGGFVKNNEDVDAAAIRILRERTGIKNLYLKQFQTFGKADRVDVEENKKILKRLKAPVAIRRFYSSRFVTVGYFALVKYEEITIEAGKDQRVYKWVDVNDVPVLYIDHNHIINEALNMIRLMIDHFPLINQLLPEKFILPDLKAIYEGILGHSLDKRNFQKKMLTSGLIKRLDERKPVNTCPQPYYYVFNKKEE